MSTTAIVAYLTLFTAVAFAFVLGALVLGWFFRIKNPTQQKRETYECGEPAVGPGSVQFDLRFYVIALVFLIFEVEVAFFFPPATIFGRANHVVASPDKVASIFPEAGCVNACVIGENNREQTVQTFSKLAGVALLDLAAFFAVLMVGFAYVWRRGDLDWVRAVRHPRQPLENNADTLKFRSADRS